MGGYISPDDLNRMNNIRTTLKKEAEEELYRAEAQRLRQREEDAIAKQEAAAAAEAQRKEDDWK